MNNTESPCARESPSHQNSLSQDSLEEGAEKIIASVFLKKAEASRRWQLSGGKDPSQVRTLTPLSD